MPARRIHLLPPVLAAAAVAGALVAAPPAAAEPDLATCTGYAEPRLPLETQNWWTRDASTANPSPDDTLDGDDEHAHLRVCFPGGNQVVSGRIRFDLQWAAHNVPDGRVEFLRIQSATDQGGVDTIVNEDLSTETAPLCAGVDDCAGTLTVELDTDAMATGMHELRFHHDYGRADGARMLATTGWTLCVRSCAGVTPQAVANDGSEIETRGRWRQPPPDGTQHGYTNARLRSALPWSASTGYTRLQGDWCPRLRTLAGAGGDPVLRTFISIDPRFHHMPGSGGDPGVVVVDEAAPIDRPVCIDTTRLADGMHKLFVRADARNGDSGMNGGVFVIPFLVANGGGATTTTSTTTPSTTTTSTTSTTVAPPPDPSMSVAITNVRPYRKVRRWIGIDVAVTGPVACVHYFLDSRQIAEDCTPTDFDEPWDSRTVPDGTYQLWARAVGGAGASATSTAIPIVVDN